MSGVLAQLVLWNVQQNEVAEVKAKVAIMGERGKMVERRKRVDRRKRVGRNMVVQRKNKRG
jgi:hypothetical protein